jgi:hypothetical protein
LECFSAIISNLALSEEIGVIVMAHYQVDAKNREKESLGEYSR